jgi:hypothetical protein
MGLFSCGMCMNYTKSRNYKSATMENGRVVELQIKGEIAEGRYVICEEAPLLVSSLGAIVKPNKVDVRIIHDFSRPNGGVNAYVEDTSVTYSTIDQIAFRGSPFV